MMWKFQGFVQGNGHTHRKEKKCTDLDVNIQVEAVRIGH